MAFFQREFWVEGLSLDFLIEFSVAKVGKLFLQL